MIDTPTLPIADAFTRAARAVRAWPAGRPLVVVCDPTLGPRLAEPTHAEVLSTPARARERLGGLSQPEPETGVERRADAPSGWAVALSYDAGCAFDPAIAGRVPTGDEPGAWPALMLFRVQEWADRGSPVSPPPESAQWAYRLAALSDPAGEEGYIAGVERTLEYIRAGDCYQANLARELRGAFAGSARALFADLLETARPAFGVYLEHTQGTTRRAVCSASPELFLSYSPSDRIVRTRPMKGTRPIASPERSLHDAEKDRAELDMITDLMRNDLGRVARFGSVRVERERTIERHADSVLQATASVRAELRDGMTRADLLDAAFPPGSVTGAPKIRATQIIRELEPFARGVYCGTLGWLGDDDSVSLSVGIRTASIVGPAHTSSLGALGEGAQLTYPIGAGIVADSDPASELAETTLKAEVIRRLVNCTGMSADKPVSEGVVP